MGTVHTQCLIENTVDHSKRATIRKILVDTGSEYTGSEYTWITTSILERIGVEREKKDLTFVIANGGHVTRSVGFAVIHVGNTFTVDEVVFAEKGDLLLLGARTLEGLNLMVDPRAKKLVAAGPIPAAPSMAQNAGRWELGIKRTWKDKYSPRLRRSRRSSLAPTLAGISSGTAIGVPPSPGMSVRATPSQTLAYSRRRVSGRTDSPRWIRLEHVTLKCSVAPRRRRCAGDKPRR